MQSLTKKLIFLTLFCVGLEIFRLLSTGKLSYIFLPANLFLAWIPFIISRQINREKNRLLLAGMFPLWLIFFPNAPYIITDLMHLKERTGIPLWFDAILIYSFALTGLLLGMASASLIYYKVRQFLSPFVSKLFMLFVMLVSGYGIYAGRTLRYNSWDILTDPLGLPTDTLHRLLHPTWYPQAYGMTIITGTLLCLVFWLFESLTAKMEV